MYRESPENPPAAPPPPQKKVLTTAPNLHVQGPALRAPTLPPTHQRTPQADPTGPWLPLSHGRPGCPTRLRTPSPRALEASLVLSGLLAVALRVVSMYSYW